MELVVKLKSWFARKSLKVEYTRFEKVANWVGNGFIFVSVVFYALSYTPITGNWLVSAAILICGGIILNLMNRIFALEREVKKLRGK